MSFLTYFITSGAPAVRGKALQLEEKIEQLEEQLERLDHENFKLRQRVRAYQYDRVKLHAIQRLASTGSWELDQVSGFFKCTDELLDILHVGANTISSWEDFRRFIHPADKSMADDILHQSVMTKESFEIEHRLLLPTQEVKWVKHYFKSFFVPTGMVVSSVGQLQEIEESAVEDKR